MLEWNPKQTFSNETYIKTKEFSDHIHLKRNGKTLMFDFGC